MRVLLSIKPQYAVQIFDGSKKYEFRRRIFRSSIKSVLVYATKPISGVLGEFEIAEILMDTPTNIWTLTAAESGVSKKFFDEYFSGRPKAFAIKVGAIERYRTPLALSDISRSCKPPQSYMYIEDEFRADRREKAQIEMFSAP
ncbi:putative transcriptional regulator [Methylobacterium sp. BE186]|uniref:hypothetical protein n=1 Tax=Methylobacterium sp. BE186 TaxID=2817715 RepID=UPI0028589937|nr:hypothetical protein [Methylobacterium sp. BE186]MDR7040316.1 putative transcriptional regulator [Methylobacterium sp. BE186]